MVKMAGRAIMMPASKKPIPVATCLRKPHSVKLYLRLQSILMAGLQTFLTACSTLKVSLRAGVGGSKSVSFCFIPRPSIYPLYTPKYPLLGTIYP